MHGGGATTSPTTWVAALSDSASALASWASLTRTLCHHWYAPGGNDPCLQRVGGRMVAHLARRSSTPAPVPPTRLSCHGLDRCTSHTSATWTCSAVLDMARHFERPMRAFAYLPDRARSLRAMDRRLCPWSRRARAQRRRDHHDWHNGRHEGVKRGFNCHFAHFPNYKSCLTEFQPTPAHASHSTNSPAHAHMF